MVPGAMSAERFAAAHITAVASPNQCFVHAAPLGTPAYFPDIMVLMSCTKLMSRYVAAPSFCCTWSRVDLPGGACGQVAITAHITCGQMCTPQQSHTRSMALCFTRVLLLTAHNNVSTDHCAPDGALGCCPGAGARATNAYAGAGATSSCSSCLKKSLATRITRARWPSTLWLGGTPSLPYRARSTAAAAVAQ